MTEETRIIIKNRLIKSAKDLCTKESSEVNRMTFILGARKLLLLLYQNDVITAEAMGPLFDDLDLNKVKL